MRVGDRTLVWQHEIPGLGVDSSSDLLKLKTTEDEDRKSNENPKPLASLVVDTKNIGCFE